MARARNIKPGFFKNEDLAECSPWARLCFIGLWMLADRAGRLEDRAKRFKAELFAYDSVDVEPLLKELARYGFIVRYEVDGRRFIQVSKFHEHQSPHYTEKESVIPPPPLPESDEHEDLKDSKKTPGVDGSSRGVRYPLNPDSLIPDSLNPEEATSDDVAGPRPSPEGPQLALVEAKSEKPSLPDCPHLDLLQAWAEELPTMPQHRPELWRGARADHLRARWREQAAQRKWQASADGVAWFRRLFGYIGQSDFLTGRTASQNGRPPFQIELEWLAMPTNFAKVLEGKYHREAAA
jgi:hypothetical protein